MSESDSAELDASVMCAVAAYTQRDYQALSVALRTLGVLLEAASDRPGGAAERALEMDRILVRELLTKCGVEARAQ